MPQHLTPVRVILAARPPVRSPSVARKAVNLVRAAGTVAGAALAGEPVLVSAEAEARRRAGCAACPEGRWDAAGNAGLGECRHPECGCTGLKLKLAAMRCPLDPPVWREEVGHA